MGKANKTTAQKLKGVKTYEAQERLLREWRDNWYSDQCKVVNVLRQAAVKDDHNTIMHMISILEGMTEKRFGTFSNMIKIINHREYDLVHYNVDDVSDTCEYELIIADSCDDDCVVDDNVMVKKSFSKRDIKEINIDEMVKFYQGGMSVKELAMDYGIGQEKATKLLVTAGVYTSDLYDEIQEMRHKGNTDEEIAKVLGLSKKKFNRYVPYTKGIYGLVDVSENARKLRKMRQKRLTK